MAFLFILGAIFLSVALFNHALLLWRLHKLRKNHVYPEKHSATLVDVIRLKQSGYFVLAIRCYREIYPCSLKEAKEIVSKI